MGYRSGRNLFVVLSIASACTQSATPVSVTLHVDMAHPSLIPCAIDRFTVGAGAVPSVPSARVRATRHSQSCRLGSRSRYGLEVIRDKHQ